MTEEKIKEELSNNYIGALASRAGYILTKPASDYGVDYYLSGTSMRTDKNGKSRMVSNGKPIEIQMKCTTLNTARITTDFVTYPLEAKTYNDLIPHDDTVPRILVLVVLPAEIDKWVEVDSEGLILRHSAYWYKLENGVTETLNSFSIRINIPIGNRFTVETWPKLYAELYQL